MRTTTPTLDSASTSPDRSPVARITIRDIRLRFASFTSQTNPVGNNDDTTFSDQVLAPNGTTIARAITNGTTIYTSSVAPGTAGNWATWTNLSLATLANSGVGLITDTDIYLFYITTGGTLAWKKSTNQGSTYGAATSTGISVSAPCTIAPVSKDEVFIISRVGSGAGAALKITRAINSGGWTSADMPWRIFGDPTDGSDWLSNGILHFDAEKVGSKVALVYGNRFYGLAYTMMYSSGLYSNPQLLLPDDYTKFYPAKMSLIQGRLWLTGYIVRDNASAYSPTFDCYLYSDDGENWTALARDTYLCSPTPTVQGKLHLSGSYVYYSGASSVYRAPASYLIDPAGDPVGMKMVIGPGQNDDLISAQIDYPSAGTAPALTLDLASADDAYFPGNSASVDKSLIAKGGSEVWVEAGYLTSAQPATGEMVQIFQGNIDTIDLALSDGQRDAKIAARDSAYKHLRDYVSPFAWDMGSQLKSFDEMNSLDNFAIQTGNWERLSDNLLTCDVGFEQGATGWSNLATGTAAGSRTRTTEDYNSGAYGYQLIKTGGANTDQWGVSTTLAVEAGVAYQASIQAHCVAIAGPGTALSYSLEVSGNYGLAGAAASDKITQSDTLSFFTDMSLAFTPQTDATVTLSFYFEDCTTGTITIDDAAVQDTSPSYVTFKFDNDIQEGILFSTETPILDFDISMRATDANSVAPASAISMGLVGLAADSSNFVMLDLARVNGNSYLRLFKRRGGNYIQLATYTISASDVLSNTAYDIRLLHRGGHFWGFTKAASSTSWGSAKINYTWSATDGALCATADGKGKLGTRVAIRPNRFHAYGIDPYSTLVCLRADNDADWSIFSGSGEVLWESERITYAGKTSANARDVVRQFNFAGDTSWQECARDSSAASCHFSQAPYSWGSFVTLLLNGSPADDAFNNYGIVFPTGGEPGAAWLITDFVGNYGGKTFLTTDGDSGHANTNGQANGAPNWHIFSAPNVTCQITPALRGCTRGANGTQAVRHPDNSLVFQFPDDQVRIDQFQIYDNAIDYSHESLLRRISAMAGILSCAFDTREFSSTYVISAPSTWSALTLKDWTGADFTGFYDYELSFDVGALSNGMGVGVMWRGNYCAFISYATGTGYSAGFSFGLPDAGSSLNHSHVLPIQPTVGVALHLRFVVVSAIAAIYINGMLVGNFAQQFPLTDSGTIKLVGIGSSVNISNLHVPDLLSWREWAIINSGEDGKDNLDRIIGDRPIYMVSQTGAGLKFSSFDRRASLGTFGDTIYSDDQTPDDSEVATFYRVEAEDIIEKVDSTLAAEHGLLHRHLAMQEATTPEAAVMMDRLIRRSQEVVGGRSQTMPANLAFEIEDEFTADFDASGTGLTINQSLIANDLHYVLSLAIFEMTVGARKFIS